MTIIDGKNNCQLCHEQASNLHSFSLWWPSDFPHLQTLQAGVGMYTILESRGPPPILLGWTYLGFVDIGGSIFEN